MRYQSPMIAVVMETPHSRSFHPRLRKNPKTRLAQMWPVVTLFCDQRIFVNAPPYHWHVQSAVGVDGKASQQLVALVNQLYTFGHCTKEHEMELWSRLGHQRICLGCSIYWPQIKRTCGRSMPTLWESYLTM